MYAGQIIRGQGVDAGGGKYWLKDGHNGYLVPGLGRARFAERLKQLLLDKPLARQPGENGRKLVSEGFDFLRYIIDIETMLARVTRKG